MVDLRALAERLGQIKLCEHCAPGGYLEGRVCICEYGRRMPNEAEVREAIFKDGWGFVDLFVEPDDVQIEVTRSVSRGPVHTVHVSVPETAPNDLVLLALLRALEVARNG